eukprot:scaffold92178_cov36-Phaeocystis_antarctica.AAC.1
MRGSARGDSRRVARAASDTRRMSDKGRIGCACAGSWKRAGLLRRARAATQRSPGRTLNPPCWDCCRLRPSRRARAAPNSPAASAAAGAGAGASYPRSLRAAARWCAAQS